MANVGLFYLCLSKVDTLLCFANVFAVVAVVVVVFMYEFTQQCDSNLYHLMHECKYMYVYIYIFLFLFFSLNILFHKFTVFLCLRFVSAYTLHHNWFIIYATTL